MDYEAPSITEVGSIADLTQGALANSSGDGASWRGPAPKPKDFTS